MGEIDIENLHKIYRACTDFSKLAGLSFKFQEDSGHKETMIRIWEDGRYEKPETDRSLSTVSIPQSRWFVPDVMDFQNKIIIEFDETPGAPRKGARLARKGHDPDGNDIRTSWRDLYYGLAKFRLLKIFDFEFKDEALWKCKLFRFLVDCYENKAEVPT